jgi:4a-hydroxytetrahydrobiopterin dehydratase
MLRVGPDLASERCLPCEQGTPPLSGAEAQALLSELDTRWHLAEDGRALTRQVTFKTFARAMAFLNRLAEIAEREGHHPDFCLTRWNQVGLSLTTHAIGGLSRNDFVLAAKLQAAIKPPSET